MGKGTGMSIGERNHCGMRHRTPFAGGPCLCACRCACRCRCRSRSGWGIGVTSGCLNLSAPASHDM